MMRAQVPEVGPLTILGPPGIERFIRQVHESLNFFLIIPCPFLNGMKDVRRWLMKTTWSVSYGAFKNIQPLCLGYRLEEHPRPGKFQARRSQGFGIPYRSAVGEITAWGSRTHWTGERPYLPTWCSGPRPRTEEFATPSTRGPQVLIDCVRMWIWAFPRRHVLTRTSRGSRGEGTT